MESQVRLKRFPPPDVSKPGNKLKSRGSRAHSVSTYNFSTLYTFLPHHLIKDYLVDLIERTFQRKALFILYIIIGLLS